MSFFWCNELYKYFYFENVFYGDLKFIKIIRIFFFCEIMIYILYLINKFKFELILFDFLIKFIFICVWLCIFVVIIVINIIIIFDWVLVVRIGWVWIRGVGIFVNICKLIIDS